MSDDVDGSGVACGSSQADPRDTSCILRVVLSRLDVVGSYPSYTSGTEDSVVLVVAHAVGAVDHCYVEYHGDVVALEACNGVTVVRRTRKVRETQVVHDHVSHPLVHADELSHLRSGLRDFL